MFCNLLLLYVLSLLFPLHSQIKTPCRLHNKSLPIPLSSFQIAYFHQLQRVYIFGGSTTGFNDSSSNAIYRWDFANDSDSWFNRTNLTTPTHTFTSFTDNVVVINNTAYFIGTYHSKTDYSTQLYIFNANNETFYNVSSKPLISTIEGCVVTNNTHLFMIGGFDQWGNNGYYAKTIQIYNILENKWTVTNITIADYQGTSSQYCQMIDNMIYVFYGTAKTRTGVRLMPTYYTFSLISDDQNNITNNTTEKVITINSGSNTNFGFSNGASQHFDSRILLIQGLREDHTGKYQTSNQIDIFNIKTTVFEKSFYLNESLQRISSVIINKSLYILGGYRGEQVSLYDGSSVDVVQVCDLENVVDEENEPWWQQWIVTFIIAGIALFVCVSICCICVCMWRSCNRNLPSDKERKKTMFSLKTRNNDPGLIFLPNGDEDENKDGHEHPYKVTEFDFDDKIKTKQDMKEDASDVGEDGEGIIHNFEEIENVDKIEDRVGDFDSRYIVTTTGSINDQETIVAGDESFNPESFSTSHYETMLGK